MKAGRGGSYFKFDWRWISDGSFKKNLLPMNVYVRSCEALNQSFWHFGGTENGQMAHKVSTGEQKTGKEKRAAQIVCTYSRNPNKCGSNINRISA